MPPQSSPLASAVVHSTDVVSTTYSIDDESLDPNTMQNGEREKSHGRDQKLTRDVMRGLRSNIM